MATGNKNRFCDIIEYRMSSRDRVMENELSIHGLYVVMFELGETGRAARYPALIDKLDQTETGKSKIQFRTYDDDLRILSRPLLSSMGQGFIDAHRIQIPPHFTATEGYFKGYEEASDLELEMMSLLESELSNSSL